MLAKLGQLWSKKKSKNQVLYPKICVAEKRFMICLDTEWGTHWEVLRTEGKHNV